MALMRSRVRSPQAPPETCGTGKKAFFDRYLEDGGGGLKVAGRSQWQRRRLAQEIDTRIELCPCILELDGGGSARVRIDQVRQILRDTFDDQIRRLRWRRR